MIDNQKTARSPLGWRGFFADTLALVVFFTCTGIINERFIAGMDWAEVLDARLIGAPLMVLTARPYGMWRDFVLRIAGQPRGLRLLFWDGAALLVFQVPIYIAIIVLGGAEGAEITRGALGVSVMMLVLGRPYGMFLEWVRARMGVTGRGQAPMSLGG
ncbi:L-alanine exporter AlaE [Sulfitobacter sp. S190]|nr:L-alanine exporter AlaE [Sulfitobacter sp. S190]